MNYTQNTSPDARALQTRELHTRRMATPVVDRLHPYPGLSRTELARLVGEMLG